MLDRPREDLFDRRLESESHHEIIDDASYGETQGGGYEHTVMEGGDGAIRRFGARKTIVRSCGHSQNPDEPFARCEACSHESGRPAYVCQKCAVTCHVTGESLCLRHTQLGPDNRRYSPEGLRQARRMGLIQTTVRRAEPSEVMPQAVCLPGRGVWNLLRRLLGWW